MYYQYIITLIFYRLYCLICLEIAMCPFYEYPTHNNQHAFFLMFIICFLRSIHCNYIEWFSWFTNFNMVHENVNIIDNIVMSINGNVSTSGMSINGSSRSHGVPTGLMHQACHQRPWNQNHGVTTPSGRLRLSRRQWHSAWVEDSGIQRLENSQIW